MPANLEYDDIEKVISDWANTETEGPMESDLRLLADRMWALVGGERP